MPVLYPILSAITKINNKPASFLLFGLEDNYDPELLNSISFETKRKKEKKMCVDFEKITIKETVLTFDQKKRKKDQLQD